MRKASKNLLDEHMVHDASQPCAQLCRLVLAKGIATHSNVMKVALANVCCNHDDYDTHSEDITW